MEFNFPRLTVSILKDELRKAFNAGVVSMGGDGLQQLPFDHYWTKNSSEIIRRTGIKITGQRVKVVLVTRLDPNNPTFNPHKPYVWQDYEGWEGRVLKESENGGVPAWEVKISGDRINFVRMIINKTDIEVCQ